MNDNLKEHFLMYNVELTHVDNKLTMIFKFIIRDFFSTNSTGCHQNFFETINRFIEKNKVEKIFPLRKNNDLNNQLQKINPTTTMI